MSGTRHAYCIIAHHAPELLKLLVAAIDDERNDIFLLVDGKADLHWFDEVRPRCSGFYLAPRVNIHWGAMSLVRAELSVLRTAHAHGPYGYYHLISGVDLPLHGQDWIHAYCDRHQGDEFIRFCDVNEDVLDHCRYHHLLLEFMRTRNPIVRKGFSLIRKTVIALERALGYERRFPYPIRKGDNWFSLTDAAVAYLLSREREIWTRLNHIHTADEIVFHTLLGDSPFMDRVHPGGYMRMIDWRRGSPYVWQEEDAEELRRSACFFARKFPTDPGELPWIRAFVREVCAQ